MMPKHPSDKQKEIFADTRRYVPYQGGRLGFGVSVEATPEQQLHFLSRDVQPLVKAVVDGFTCDPGHSDLDDEQPISVRMTLGDYRRARRLLCELSKQNA